MVAVLLEYFAFSSFNFFPFLFLKSFVLKILLKVIYCYLASYAWSIFSGKGFICIWTAFKCFLNWSGFIFLFFTWLFVFYVVSLQIEWESYYSRGLNKPFVMSNFLILFFWDSIQPICSIYMLSNIKQPHFFTKLYFTVMISCDHWIVMFVWFNVWIYSLFHNFV